ncbi:site-specific integrase [Micromonospora sp. NPDC049679]|uniref:tyrosine-type recombinase/integrase n=1 Tax=Micromonospora sp. NPDC049679 TaxID=3155920 RepID=UPI0033DE692A
MRNHVLPQWSAMPLGKIDHLSVQRWVTDLGRRLSPATVAKCHQLTAGVFRAAQRDRLIGINPCDGVRLPSIRRKDSDGQVITPADVTSKLVPAVPQRYRALVGLAAGTGLRWGECVGLRWNAVDLTAGVVHVVRVAVEVAGNVTTRPFPKSRAGRRTVPLPPFVMQLLVAHRETYSRGPVGEIFTNTAGGPLRRTLFRSRVWRPALVRAGLLGEVTSIAVDRWRACWLDAAGHEQHQEFATEREAVGQVAKQAASGLRFHDLRHSYATWLVSSGVPINDVQKVMGHEQASTTLNRYTHGSDDRDARVRGALADFRFAERSGKQGRPLRRRTLTWCSTGGRYWV